MLRVQAIPTAERARFLRHPAPNLPSSVEVHGAVTPGFEGVR
jgi:hypothetical protein